MVFWSINFFARGIRLGSLLLDQTGRPPVKQRATELWTPEVGTPLGSVAECLSNRGATHKRTGSAGMSHGETLSIVSPAITGRGSDSGPDTTKCGRDRIRVGTPSPLSSS